MLSNWADDTSIKKVNKFKIPKIKFILNLQMIIEDEIKMASAPYPLTRYMETNIAVQQRTRPTRATHIHGTNSCRTLYQKGR